MPVCVSPPFPYYLCSPLTVACLRFPAVSILSVLAADCCLSAFPADPDEFDYEYPDVQPVFLSRPASYSVQDGDSIVLPCEINDLGQCLQCLQCL